MIQDLKQYIRKQLNEGISLGSNSFEFNYNADSDKDLIKLCTPGILKKEFNGIEYLYYSYKFEPDISSYERTKFIQEFKFSTDFSFKEERLKFIKQAVNILDKEINIASYDVLVVPESKSDVIQEIQDIIYKRQRPGYSMVSYQLVKELPEHIQFDYDSFEENVLNSWVNGRPRYTSKQKEEVIIKIRSLMEDIHKLNYFSIARDVKKNLWRGYIEKYLKFANSKEEKLFYGLTNSKILIVDDIVTSGSTMEQILKCISCVRDPYKDNEITLFSIIGR